jgi:hypothetical protein
MLKTNTTTFYLKGSTTSIIQKCRGHQLQTQNYTKSKFRPTYVPILDGSQPVIDRLFTGVDDGPVLVVDGVGGDRNDVFDVRLLRARPLVALVALPGELGPAIPPSPRSVVVVVAALLTGLGVVLLVFVLHRPLRFLGLQFDVKKNVHHKLISLVSFHYIFLRQSVPFIFFQEMLHECGMDFQIMITKCI